MFVPRAIKRPVPTVRPKSQTKKVKTTLDSESIPTLASQTKNVQSDYSKYKDTSATLESTFENATRKVNCTFFTQNPLDSELISKSLVDDSHSHELTMNLAEIPLDEGEDEIKKYSVQQRLANAEEPVCVVWYEAQSMKINFALESGLFL